MNLDRNSKDYDIVMRYYDSKNKCPKCGGKIVETNIAPPQYVPGKEYRDRTNKTQCQDPECGWRGLIDECRP